MKTHTVKLATTTLSEALREADLSAQEYAYMVHSAIGYATHYEETRHYHKAEARTARAFAHTLTVGLKAVLRDRAAYHSAASTEPPLKP